MSSPWWMQSPAPALYVRPQSTGYGWEPNEAASRWARETAVPDDTFGRLASDVGRLSTGAASGACGTTLLDPVRGELRWHSMPWSDGWLAWCLPDEIYRPSPQDMLDRVEILQRFGRIGVLVRDLRTGEGHWDENTFRLWGFDPAAGAPSLHDTLERVHPDDRERLRERTDPATCTLGYSSQRFRVYMPDGALRHLHSMVNVLPGADGKPLRVIGVIVDDTETIESFLTQRKATQDAEKALALAGVAMWRIDLHRNQSFGNDVYLDRMRVATAGPGFNPELVTQRYHPEDRVAAEHANERALAGEAAVDAVVRYRYTDDGPYRTLLTRRVARRDHNGRPHELIGIGLDITDFVQVSHQAQVFARRADEAATMGGVGFWSLDPESGKGHWDAGMFAIHRRASEHGTPSHTQWVAEYAHPDDRARLMKLRTPIDDELLHSYQNHCRIVLGDGEVRWLEYSARYEKNAVRPMLIGTVVDVTDKKAAWAALQLEQQRTRFAADAVGLGVWECTLDGQHLYWNAQMYKLHGLEPSDPRPLGHLWKMAHSPSERANLDRAIHQHAKSGEPLQHEMRVVTGDGSERWLALRGTVIAGTGRRKDRVYGVSWDITQLRRAEHQRHEQETALEASRARTELVAQLGRTLRTPLTSVLGFTRLALDQGTVPPRERGWLENVRLAGHELLHQIDDLLGAAASTHEIQPDLWPTSPVPAPMVAAAAPGVGGLTLVCIEDSVINLLLVEELVRQRPGITLHSAPSGTSGVELASRVRPQVVLIDMHLPDCDGFEVLRRLRQDPALAKTTCIVLSADAADSNIDRALAAGFDAYWTKPIDFEQFLSGFDALAQGQPVPDSRRR
jgi:PAS domain S-box-containing protein